MNTRQAGSIGPLAQQLQQSLQSDQVDIQQLQAQLHSERAVLESDNHQPLEQLAADKAQLVARLDERHRQRMQLLQQFNYSIDPQDWPQTLEAIQAASGVPLQALWQQLAAQLQETRQLLQVNEKIVGGMQQSVARFMNILRGQTGSSQTYDARGRSEYSALNQPISSA